MLTSREINRLAPDFLEKLREVTGRCGARAIDIISRRGIQLDANQVKSLLAWLNSRSTFHNASYTACLFKAAG